MSNLKLENINKIYPNNVQAVFDFNLSIKDKEFIVFVGPSGCGKSTTLRMVAGLENITSGKLFIDNNLVNDIEPMNRGIAMVFQTYALYPTMSVYKNIAFSLKMRKFPVNDVGVDKTKVKLGPDSKAIEECKNAISQAKVSIDEMEYDLKMKKKIESKIARNKGKVSDNQISNLSKKIEELSKTNKDAKNDKKINKLKITLQALKDKKSQTSIVDIKALEKEYDKKIEELNKTIAANKEKIAKLKQVRNVPVVQYAHMKKDEIDKRVKRAANILGLTEYLNRKPAALSGGQRQRVALGRAIVRNPKVFLMDEPLSNLDAKLRVQMRTEILRIHKEVGATTIYVTHDQTEAMTMADRIVVMKAGYIQQIASPREVYDKPSNLFVATFIGSPSMNIINVKYDGKNILFNDKVKVSIDSEFKNNYHKFYKEQSLIASKNIKEIGDYIVALNNIDKKKNASAIEQKNKLLEENKQIVAFAKTVESKTINELKFGIRPDDIYLENDPKNKKPSPAIKVNVNAIELLGQELIIHSEFNNQELIFKIPSTVKVKVGDALDICFDLNKAHLFDPATTLRLDHASLSTEKDSIKATKKAPKKVVSKKATKKVFKKASKKK